MKELNKAIIEYFGNTNDFNTAISGRLLFGKQPQGESFPYAVFTYLGNYPELLFDSNPIEMVSLQLSVFSNDTSAFEILDLIEKAKNLFDDCKLSVDNYTQYVFIRVFETYFMDIENNIWQGVIDYDIWVRKNES